ncbi:VOC family protein [Sphingomonas sp. PL-96]|uniref:VOC family protein n=1 Tax=Sphingomonas sp. PL-96 TaxID=2887201 RepID=UPI001E400912|nr:VOC family protein [Sphingomonas sp. PL-96]MCC2977936.1 VOC family protein [Sphingomonas sp. PL-96]
MRNPHGFPIWYELLTPDPDGARGFYEAVIGWTVGAPMSDAMDYRLIDTGEGEVGGIARLTPEMPGAKPGWLFYIGVDDVDAAVTRIEQAGGAVHEPPQTIAGVGGLALVVDPQGIPFYVMRGEMDEASHAWQANGPGKCGWNELTTPDQARALAFYAEVFGWAYPDRMPMGDMGDYVFVEAGGETIGAIMQRPADAPPGGWQFYFRAAEIDAAAAAVVASGGTVDMGPMDVPGDERIIVATDPHGAQFGVVAGARATP